VPKVRHIVAGLAVAGLAATGIVVVGPANAATGATLASATESVSPLSELGYSLCAPICRMAVYHRAVGAARHYHQVRQPADLRLPSRAARPYPAAVPCCAKDVAR
jgi:hypothetical protein